MRKLPLKLGLVTATAFVAGAMLGPLPSFVAQAANQSDTFRQLKLFGDVFERVRAEYVEDVGDQKLIESALDGMLTSLDPHSGYLDTDRYRDMQVQTRGEFGGLGIEVTQENGLIKVVSPIDETPAARAGVQSGDYITHIDDEAVAGLSLAEAVEKMRGPVDSQIRLRMLRRGQGEPFDVSLNRAVIKISPVRAREEGEILYLRLTTFNEQTATEMRDKVEEIGAKLGDKMKGMVLDLRNNPGGLLDQAVAVADAFLDKGEIVSTRGRRSDSIQRFNARAGDILTTKPIVVLINGGSASASEIVAGALQDHRRGIVMGTQSFGKGSVQTIMPISGGGAIRLTTAKYFTPAGTSIQAKGIVPDLEVHQANVEPLDDTSGRREADLRGRLLNDNETDDAAPPAASDDPVEAGEPPAAGTEDYQLSRALDLLRGISLFEGRSATVSRG